MPDANGNIRGSGWTRRREVGWARVFGEGSTPPPSDYTLLPRSEIAKFSAGRDTMSAPTP